MNYRHIAALTVSILLLAGPTSAVAGEFYIGGSIGSASLDDDFDGFNVDTSSTAFRFVAGWQFNEFFSLEGGYNNFGTFDQTFDVGGTPVDISLKGDGFLLGATGSIPLGEKFALTGRVGSFFWDGDADINNVTQATPEDTNLYLGVGAAFSLSERLQLTADWTRYELEDTDSGVVSLGVLFRFR